MISSISGAGPSGAIQDVRAIERPRPTLTGGANAIAAPEAGSAPSPLPSGSPRGSLLNLVV